ncbi:gamma-glutamylcyclotransferase [Tropicibacter oceani]|uniref:ADP-ribose pyrophosphatase n=1 Tax=Tropicibacter oceani TaxID=3058420 RepID=A0ABY8QMK4_9RHOB|nr:gamma-glutamylcyclotransferase [Tropicibacter oceani]WGW05870.1 gamma-glutamylcyclotransferase [Tropicibacter oceani]
MPDLFFYGTLRHLPLLELVLGRPVPEMRQARLDGYAVHSAKDQPFPMIVAQNGAQAQGVFMPGLSAVDVARLDFYEGGFAFDLIPVTVHTADGPADAQVYLPRAGQWQIGPLWSLDDWAARWGTMTVTAAREVMDRFGTMEADRIIPLLPFFRARAWARQMAASGAPQTLRNPMTMDDVSIVAEHPGFDGFFRIKSFDLRHRRFDGSQSPVMSRETFVAFDAALVLPYDPVLDKVMLIEQLRYGPIQRGDPAPWVLEPIAGLVDAGEQPEDTVRREALEETGLTIGQLLPISRGYASPGYSTEFFHCFLGLCDLSGWQETGQGGLDSEHEDIRNHTIPFDHAMALIDSGEVNAVPLAMMLLWLATKRDRLRAQA